MWIGGADDKECKVTVKRVDEEKDRQNQLFVEFSRAILLYYVIYHVYRIIENWHTTTIMELLLFD